MTLPTYAGFVNAGFLRAEGARALDENPRNRRIDGEAVARWFQSLAFDRGARFLRAYWYDARFDHSHELAEGQRRFFSALSQTAGIHLRLGQIVEFRPWYEQGIRDALARTANELNLEPDELMDEFDHQWSFRPERRQRGIEALIAADMVRLAARGTYDTAVICFGDRDLQEAVRSAQELGARIVIATPNRHSVARELNDLADEILELSGDDLDEMLPERL